MSKERVNIRMDKEIFDFYDEISKEEKISRSEAMIIGLSYYKEKMEEEKTLRETLDSLAWLKEDDTPSSMAERPACKKGKNHHHIGKELNSLNAILNTREEKDPGEDGVLEDLNKYNSMLKSLSRPIEVLTRNFNYHKGVLEKIKEHSELILDKLGFNGLGLVGEKPCNRPSDLEILKEEIKEEILREIKKDLGS